MFKTVYVATGNKSKYNDVKLFLSWIDPELNVLLVPDFIPVEEDADTIAANSKLKVVSYIGKYEYPVLAIDSGLFFDKSVTEIQDPAKTKRGALKGKPESDFTQAEIGRLMFAYYLALTKKYGGEINLELRDAFTLLLPDGKILQKTAVREYLMVSKDTADYDIYHPMNCLWQSKLTGKFVDEMNEAEQKVDKKPVLDALKQLLII